MFEKPVLLKLLFLILSQRAEAGWMLLFEEKPNKEKFHLFEPELTLFSPLSFLCCLFLNLLYQLSGAKRVQ